MTRVPPTRTLCIPELLLCLTGLAASLVPLLVDTDPFWGVNSFTDKDLFAINETPGVVILRVDPGSPAEAAGLRKGDRLVRLNGKPVQFATVRKLLDTIAPRQAVILEVRRGDEDLRLESRGESRTLEAVLFLD